MWVGYVNLIIDDYISFNKNDIVNKNCYPDGDYSLTTIKQKYPNNRSLLKHFKSNRFHLTHLWLDAFKYNEKKHTYEYVY